MFTKILAFQNSLISMSFLHRALSCFVDNHCTANMSIYISNLTISLAALTHCTSVAERFTVQPKNKDRLEII